LGLAEALGFDAVAPAEGTASYSNGFEENGTVIT
jgi:hypothetical protein